MRWVAAPPRKQFTKHTPPSIRETGAVARLKGRGAGIGAVFKFFKKSSPADLANDLDSIDWWAAPDRLAYVRRNRTHVNEGNQAQLRLTVLARLVRLVLLGSRPQFLRWLILREQGRRAAQ